MLVYYIGAALYVTSHPITPLPNHSTKKAMGLARTADLSLEGQRELALLTEGLGPEARLRVLREAAPKSGKTKSWGPPLRPRLDMSIAPSSKGRGWGWGLGDKYGRVGRRL